MSKCELNLATLLAAGLLTLTLGLANANAEETGNAPPPPTDASAPAEEGGKPSEATEATPAGEVGLSDAEGEELAAAFSKLFESEEFGRKLDEKVAKLVPVHVDAHLDLVLPAKVNELVQQNVGPLVGVAVREQLPSAIRAQRESFASAAVTAMDKRLSERGVPSPSSVSATTATVPTATTAKAPSLVRNFSAAAAKTTAPVSAPAKQVQSNQSPTMMIEGRMWFLNSDGTYHANPEPGKSYTTCNGQRCWRN